MKQVLTMSQKEIDRVSIVLQINSGQISLEQAVQLLELSARQVYRILRRYKRLGAEGLIHKLRGKPSNRGHGTVLKEKVLSLYSQQYWDYGPTLFSEILLKEHSISIDHETLRKWLLAAGLYSKQRKRKQHRRKRERRKCYGELLQFDGSYHDWFEGRGPAGCLLNCIDDATGRVYLKFVQSENTLDVLLMLREYVEEFGIPRSIYTDRASVYKGEENLSEFGRAMKELGVEVIYAKSPQAKGRVERANRTLQDRLIKALRRNNISTVDDANKYLKEVFIREYNQRFASSLGKENVHRNPAGYDLQNIFCYKTYRQVRNDYTINLAGGYIQLLKGAAPLPKPKQQVMVTQWFDGQRHIYFNNQELNYKQIEEKPKAEIRLRPPVRQDHPFRRMNQRLKSSKSRSFFSPH